MSFSPKKYFSKIQSPDVLVKYYATHNIQAFFEIGEQTPRKQAVEIMMDFYTSIDPAHKYDIERELALISSLSTKHAPPLFIQALIKANIPTIPEIECHTDHDRVLYYYTYHKKIVDEVLFFHDFYIAKGYMLYEAKEIDLLKAELAMTECAKEFKRIANKDDRVTECEVETKNLADMLYVHVTFDGAPILTPTRNKETGELDRTKTVRKLEQIRIVYLPQDKEVLISYTGNKHERLIFLDTFLRIVCDSGYEDKVQSFDLSSFKKETFDFRTTSKNVPLLQWKIKAVTVSFGESKAKKKLRLSLPSTPQEQGLSPLFSTLEEAKMTELFTNCAIENMTLSFSFTDINKPQKQVNVSCSLSTTKSSLLPLFPYDRYARTLLKLAHIDKGFIEKAKKEKEEVSKKWEA